MTGNIGSRRWTTTALSVRWSGAWNGREIGEALHISHRTVQTHLTHVYSKLGITSRVALAREAARHG